MLDIEKCRFEGYAVWESLLSSQRPEPKTSERSRQEKKPPDDPSGISASYSMNLLAQSGCGRQRCSRWQRCRRLISNRFFFSRTEQLGMQVMSPILCWFLFLHLDA